MAEASDVREREGDSYGGSAAGIRSHYDISNDFWPAVLGPTMAYSSALYATPGDSLDDAQARKIAWHVAASGAGHANAVLDVGCGWGSALVPLTRQPGRRLTGLTLSDAQADYLRSLRLDACEVRVENWADHEPRTPYDSIISIGAFEHFAKPCETTPEKIAVYRDFFERCRAWLAPNGRMSLQTIAYGNMRSEEASPFLNDVIFPESELPRLSEITAALDGIFEVVAIRNDRFHYALTMEAWGRNLARSQSSAVTQVGEDKVADMLRFFKMAAMGFRMGKQQLLRFALRPVTTSWCHVGRASWEDVAAVDASRSDSPL